MRLQIFGLLLGLLSFVSALSATGSKLLVVIEDDVDKSQYSQLWKSLQERGFQLDYKSPKDSSLTLFNHGVPAASHLLLFPTKAKGLGPALTPNLLVEFVNGGSNVLLALSADNTVPTSISSLLAELDIGLSPDRNSLVVDHWNYDTKSAAEKHDVLVLDTTTNKKTNVEDYFSVDGPVAFPRAVGQILGNASPLLASIVKAPLTAYIYNPKEDAEGAEEAFATGSQINIVSAFQARNSARVTVLGSVEALADKWFSTSVQLPGSAKKSGKTGNKAFAQKLTSWAFKETGVLKAGQVNHFLKEGKEKGALNPTIYRIKNDVHYSIELSEWATDKWVPFSVPAGDQVQLEVSMLSPFHRLNLAPSGTTENSTTFTSEFKLPDQHGIFNYFVEYRRPFLTNIEEKRTVTVRHFAHDEWPRSFVISAAYPWISGIWVTVVGWLIFVAVWLYSAPAAAKKNVRVEKR